MLAGAAPNTHTHSYLPLTGGTLTGNVNLSGSTNHVLIGGTASSNHYNSTAATTGLTFGGGNDFNNYSIGTSMQNIGGNYTKLNIKWHTGIRFFVLNNYGGVRFHSDVGMTTELMSIGNTDGHVRVANNLYANGSGLVWNANNDGAGSGLDADLLDGNHASAFMLAGAAPNAHTHSNYYTKDAETTSTTSLILEEDWGSNTYNGQFVIKGSYPSWETRGNSGQPYGWLHHQDSNGQYTLYSIAGYTGDSWTQRYTFNKDGTFRNGGPSGNVYYHQGNDGSGSGLDADLLDGYNAEETAVNNSIVKRDGSAMITAKKLYLNGGNYEGQIVFGAADTWRTGLRQHDDGDAELRIWAKNANGRVHIATGYDGQPASIAKPTDGFVVDHNNVGIGNFSATDPSEKLHVKGSILATGNITAYSDERLKSDIQTLDGKKVLQMRGVSFTKDGEAGSGVIAQELEKVAPELVRDGEYKSVAYGNITGYLIEAIKEQSAQINAQQEQINQLTILVKSLTEK
jgi:hypothetical protein